MSDPSVKQKIYYFQIRGSNYQSAIPHSDANFATSGRRLHVMPANNNPRSTLRDRLFGYELLSGGHYWSTDTCILADGFAERLRGEHTTLFVGYNET